MDSPDKVKCCPRCGGEEFAHGFSMPPMQGTVECHREGCEIIAVSDTEADAIAMWNAGHWSHRCIDYDENGHRVIDFDEEAIAAWNRRATPEAPND